MQGPTQVKVRSARLKAGGILASVKEGPASQTLTVCTVVVTSIS